MQEVLLACLKGTHLTARSALKPLCGDDIIRQLVMPCMELVWLHDVCVILCDELSQPCPPANCKSTKGSTFRSIEQTKVPATLGRDGDKRLRSRFYSKHLQGPAVIIIQDRLICCFCGSFFWSVTCEKLLMHRVEPYFVRPTVQNTQRTMNLK